MKIAKNFLSLKDAMVIGETMIASRADDGPGRVIFKTRYSISTHPYSPVNMVSLGHDCVGVYVMEVNNENKQRYI